MVMLNSVGQVVSELYKGAMEGDMSFQWRPGTVADGLYFLQITTGEDFLFEGTVSIVEALGEVTLLYIEGLVPGEPIIAKIPGILAVRRGDKVRFTADKARLHLFDAAGNSYRAA